MRNTIARDSQAPHASQEEVKGSRPCSRDLCAVVDEGIITRVDIQLTLKIV